MSPQSAVGEPHASVSRLRRKQSSAAGWAECAEAVERAFAEMQLKMIYKGLLCLHSQPNTGMWSSGMIPALGAGGPEFDSLYSPEATGKTRLGRGFPFLAVFRMFSFGF